MPWKGLRPPTAGGRTSRRNSFLEETDPPGSKNDAEGQLVGSIGKQVEGSHDPLMGDQSRDTASRSPTPPPPQTLHAGHGVEDIPEPLSHSHATKVPKNRRFSLLKFRHASDPQLSRSFASLSTNPTPPLPNSPTPTIVTTAPVASHLGSNGKIKDKLKLLGRSPNSSKENVAKRRQSFGPVSDALSPPMAQLQNSDGTGVSANQSHVSFEEPSRSSLLPPGGGPPAYGEVPNRSLPLPPLRLSESSRSSASFDAHGIYAETTTTHTVSTTTTFFRLPRRKKGKKHLFPLPVKIPPPEYTDGIKTPALSHKGRTSISPRRSSPPTRDPVTAVYGPERRAGSVSEHPSPLPSPTHSALAFTNTPLGSAGPSIYRKNSIASHRSASSTRAVPMPPPLLGSRRRSSTMGSMNKAIEGERLSSPPVVPPGRTSTSTSSRMSFGDFFTLSHKLRHNSEPSSVGYGRTRSGTPGTPASTSSKSNSFLIPPELAIYPERAEEDTPATYLAKLEAAVNRGVIAALLCKGYDDFSKTCLRKYMRGFAYFGDSIDMAVRKMLMGVELPKETQQIDRLLQGFADRYCECNPGIFASADEAYFVAFSILLLHSDTHNKNNKRKMQKQDYVKNTQDQVEVSNDILECFYDNVSYTPFIHFEDEVAINSHRSGPLKPKKALFQAASTDNFRGPVDPYALILDQKLEILRPSLKDVMDTEDSYSCTGTASSLDANGLYQAFHKAGVLQIVSARSRPNAFLSPATISNPTEAQVGLVDIKAAKVGVLWRKDPNRKKARSPWQEWGALLTGSQLYFFRDVAWIRSLVSQYESHQKQGSDANLVVFKPPLASFQPDALLSMDDAVALLDGSYKKHKHAFLFIKHGGFEEVFLANSEVEMNDWIAKLNYAATFRTAGVRMRGFIGANYEGQGPDLGRNDSATSTRRGDDRTLGRQINQQLAGEILAYRREVMTDKIAKANDKLATTQKELDNLLRNARHLQICLPIQSKSREALVLAAGRMSAKLRWTRVEMWRERCHRDIMKMDLEQEIVSGSATSILRESFSLRSKPQKGPLNLINQSLPKSVVKGGDLATSPRSTHSAFSSKSKPLAVLDREANSDLASHVLSDSSVQHDRALSNASAEQSVMASESVTDNRDRASLLSIKSRTAPSLHHRISVSSSYLGRADAENLGQDARLSTAVPSMDGQEVVLREAGLLDSERASLALHRPDTSESDGQFATITSPEAVSRDRSSVRRSLHRTLRDPQHTLQNAHGLRHRKAKEPALHPPSASASLRRISKSGSEGLERGTGSFTVHGKKASVVTFGSEWQSMSNEDRVGPRQQAQTDEKEADSEGDTPTPLSAKAEADEDGQQDINLSEANTVPAETRNDKTGSLGVWEEAQPERNEPTPRQDSNSNGDIQKEETENSGGSTYDGSGPESETASKMAEADAPLADYPSLHSTPELHRIPTPQTIQA